MRLITPLEQPPQPSRRTIRLPLRYQGKELGVWIFAPENVPSISLPPHGIEKLHQT